MMTNMMCSAVSVYLQCGSGTAVLVLYQVESSRNSSINHDLLTPPLNAHMGSDFGVDPARFPDE